MRTLNTVNMSPSMLPQESSIGETLVTEATSQIRVSSWIHLAVEMVLQFSVV